MATDGNPGDNVPPNGEVKPNDNTPPAAMSLTDINTLTGRSYSTLEEAQNGIKETYSFIGKKPVEKVVEKIVEKIPDNVVRREEYERSEFFRDNPKANAHKQLLETLAKANGTTEKEIFTGNAETNPVTKYFMETSQKLDAADEVTNARSALTSTARLGVVGDASTKAMEAFEQSQKARATGDILGADKLQKVAEANALDAVIKAYGLDGKKITD